MPAKSKVTRTQTIIDDAGLDVYPVALIFECESEAAEISGSIVCPVLISAVSPDEARGKADRVAWQVGDDMNADQFSGLLEIKGHSVRVGLPQLQRVPPHEPRQGNDR